MDSNMARDERQSLDPLPDTVAMRSLEQLVKDGFVLEDGMRRWKSVALVSLRVANRAYLSTYHHVETNLPLFDPSRKGRDSKAQGKLDETRRMLSGRRYVEACMEAIVHYHHFAELVLKDALRAEHPLLAANASRAPELLYRLLKGGTATADELAGLASDTFSEMLRKGNELAKSGTVSAGVLGLVPHHHPVLQHLGTLRNRLTHGGTYVLSYPALDELVGGYVLPFVSAVVALPEYAALTDVWKYQMPASKLDPLVLIEAEFASGRYDVGKIALLKELGRAAYENPLIEGPMAGAFNRVPKARAERLARDAHADGESLDRVDTCPVCGLSALLVYDDTDSEGDPDDGTFEVWRSTWAVRCLCCTFSLNRSGIGNASEYGLPLPDYWGGQRLV